MFSFFDLLKLHNIDSSNIKLVRHSNAEIPILQTFQNNRKKFEAYQKFQAPNKFSQAKHIAAFAPYRNTLALFLGLWEIRDYKKNKEFTKRIHSIIDNYKLPQEWHNGQSYFDLKYNPILAEFSQRLIIDWGKGTIAWVQTKNKIIVEIKGKKSLGDLPTFDKIILSYLELKTLVSNPDSNNDWLNALSSVKGIYLIRDKGSGQLYVGSASGDNGIFGRWQNYALTGDGGNIALKNLNPNNFEFSILEIVSNMINQTEIIHKENLWKRKLGTWEMGLNKYEKHNIN